MRKRELKLNLKQAKIDIQGYLNQIDYQRRIIGELRVELNTKLIRDEDMTEAEKKWSNLAKVQQKVQDVVEGSPVEPGSNHHTYRVYADGSVIHEDDFDSLPEDGSDDFETVTVPEEVINHIREDGVWQCKKCYRRVNSISYTSLCNTCNDKGDKSLQEATRTEELRVKSTTAPAGTGFEWGGTGAGNHAINMVNPHVLNETTSYVMLNNKKYRREFSGNWWIGDTKSLVSSPNYIELLEKIYKDKVDAEPMLSIPVDVLPNKTNVNEMFGSLNPDKPMIGAPTGLGKSPRSSSPRYRDIGIRVDREGNFVFAPEAVSE